MFESNLAFLMPSRRRRWYLLKNLCSFNQFRAVSRSHYYYFLQFNFIAYSQTMIKQKRNTKRYIKVENNAVCVCEINLIINCIRNDLINAIQRLLKEKSRHKKTHGRSEVFRFATEIDCNYHGKKATKPNTNTTSSSHSLSINSSS